MLSIAITALELYDFYLKGAEEFAENHTLDMQLLSSKIKMSSVRSSRGRNFTCKIKNCCSKVSDACIPIPGYYCCILSEVGRNLGID